MGTNNDTGRRRSRVAKKQQEAEKTQAAAQTTPATKEEQLAASKEKRAAKKKKKRKKKHILLKIFAVLVCLGIVCCIAGGVYVAKIIKSAPDIETDDIYSLLSQTSTIYDADGKVIDTIVGDKKRTIVEIGEIPEHTQNAFIAIEDKTFRTHHGFNIIRIFGAIKDKLVHGGEIGGTSTLTQQLARNLYLEDTMSERSLDRKIREAYYAYLLEKRLSKDQIMEAYLNTVNFGDGWGIATAAKAYFNKKVEDLTLAESAALATMPNAPSYYALILRLPKDDLGEFADKVLYSDGDYTYVWNDRCKGRMKICLDFMLDQGLITEDEYNEAVNVEIKDIVKPSKSTAKKNSSYYTDFVVSSVINDFMEQFGYDREKAANIVYNGGVNIYTTLDSQAQGVLEKEFAEKSNFPYPAYYSTDANGNIISSTGTILLYKYYNYVNDKRFYFPKDDYRVNDDGSVTLFKDRWLRFYSTTVEGQEDISIEMPKMYRYSDSGYFYSIDGAYILVPQQYKSWDDDGNCVLSAQLFKDMPKRIRIDENGNLTTKYFTLKSLTIQPQSAMTVVDNNTGAVVAMIGGRGAKGSMLYNRAINTRQPGSSIKPVSVYSAALQKSFELQAQGKKYDYKDTKYDKQGTRMWGDYITAASIVVDEPMTVNGKQWPKNANGAYTGTQTLRTALQQSINTCAVKILAQVGLDYAYEHAKKFGLTTLVEEGSANDINLAALGIGGMTNGVTTLEMASAYTTFVNNGIHKSYYCYNKVTDRNGNTVMEPKKTETEVLDPGVAWIMRDILQTVVSQGIGRNATIYGETVGGKTGTTGSQSSNFDIWFDGFTANYTASLWIGADINIALSDQSPKAALLWSRIMSQIDKAKGGTYSARPSNVVTANVNKRTEYFTKGTEKNAGSGGKFTKVKICKDTGLLATPDCPHTTYKSGFQGTVGKDNTYSDLPTTYCYMHNTNPDKYKVSKKNQDELKKYTEEREKKEAEEKAKEEEEKKKKEEAEKKKKEEAEKKKQEEAEKAAREAQEKAQKEAEEKQAAYEKAKQEAYNKWLVEREEHKHPVLVKEAVYETIEHPAETHEEQVDDETKPIYGEDGETIVGYEQKTITVVDKEAWTEKVEVSPAEYRDEYDDGWKDGQFVYNP